MDEFNTDFQQNKWSFPANESPDWPIVEDNQENEIAEVSDNQSIHNSQSSKKIEENSQEESNVITNLISVILTFIRFYNQYKSNLNIGSK